MFVGGAKAREARWVGRACHGRGHEVVAYRGGRGSMPCCGARGHEWHGPRRGAFVGGAANGAVRRAAMAGNSVVNGDGLVRAGVSYLSVGAVADCLACLG